jgi:hypothetical protein
MDPQRRYSRLPKGPPTREGASGFTHGRDFLLPERLPVSEPASGLADRGKSLFPKRLPMREAASGFTHRGNFLLPERLPMREAAGGHASEFIDPHAWRHAVCRKAFDMNDFLRPCLRWGE